VIQVGVVGKPNTGKSTFFAAATLLDVKRAPYPFTTIEPNVGVGHVKVRCVCRDLGVVDNPRNSVCIEGWRFVPVELVDVAGLVPGAWQGRGLGNMFLDHVRRAPVLIHVVDASGSTDEEGRVVKPGSHDPVQDVIFFEREFEMWMYQVVSRDWERLSKTIEYTRKFDELYSRFAGLGIKPQVVQQVVEELGLSGKRIAQWSQDDLMSLVREARRASKPILIAANKADLPTAPENIKRLTEQFKGRYVVVPTSAEAELALRRAAKAGLIKYIPGSSSFEVVGRLTPEQRKALDYIEENVLKRYGSTGVQDALDKAVFELLGMIAVFPVENEKKLTDSKGNVLPDVYLVHRDSTARDLAYEIHTELGEKFAFAIDALSGRRLGSDEKLSHRMIVKIVTAR
jgi:ribosome-binding ATPase YchF (GTP1/OBG family)